MIILLDTSTTIARLTLLNGDQRTQVEWEAGRELAKGLLGWLTKSIQGNDYKFDDVEAIGVFKGPGSFTGLRIGMAVVNTLADSLSIPIVAVSGGDWELVAIKRLQNGENDGVALPLYDRDANITKPRK